ncbi:CDP-alcohol phosphatidyltransferase family protein [Asanoa sp. NPDC050611]|uniref:CDP-alcohol phosphatidyltransferase family protein n=1 Tax=Asanoa sp. NPDC050611 TaxID=3157098 RepID=UPI0033FC3023
MTVAVLLPGPDPALRDRLAAQLRAAGAREIYDELPVGLAEPVLICAGDLVAHDAVIRHVATVPGPGTVALVLPDGPGEPVHQERGQLVPGDSPTGVAGGLVRVGVADLPLLADPFGKLVADLLANGATVSAHRVRLLVARRVAFPAEIPAALAAVAEVDSERAELRLAVKEQDDFFTTYFVSTWSPYVTKAAARLRLTPTGVTAISVVVVAAAAGLFGYGGSRPAWLLAGVLLYLGFVLDCVDGQLARYTRTFSVFGGWLDTVADRAKEYLVYAGLAVGAGGAGAWKLAIAAIALQTVRHMTDTWYGTLHDVAARAPARPEAGGGVAGRLGAVSARVRADTGSVGYWLKRTAAFPIGERWAAMALLGAVFGPRVALIGVLAGIVVAFAYTLALRTLRARGMRVSAFAGVVATEQRDDGPLGRQLSRFGVGGPLAGAGAAVVVGALFLAAAYAGLDGGELRTVTLSAAVALLVAALPAGAAHSRPLHFLVPAALRAAEYLFVIAIGVAYDVPFWCTFVLLFALALWHYDLTARLEKREAGGWLHRWGLGWDARVLVMALGSAFGQATGTTVTIGFYLLSTFVLGSVIWWRNRAETAAV